MFNFKYLVGGAALVLATYALAGGPDVPPPAPLTGFYINGQGGGSVLVQPNPYYQVGYNLAASVGYRWDNIRFEVEGQYTHHAVRSVFQNPVNAFLVGGGSGFTSLSTFNIFGNIYYDFDFGNSFIPYLGAGIGWQNVWSSLNLTNNVNPLFNRRWDLSRNALTAQGILGLDYKVSDTVRVGLSYHAVLATAPSFNLLVVNNVILNNGTFRRGNRLDNQLNVGVTVFF